MNQYILKKPAIDLGALEKEIQRRLNRGKIKLLISHVLCFMLAMTIVFFVI